ncbi:hypothetical protein GQ457_14G016820 [Hibiscus cannabinus]
MLVREIDQISPLTDVDHFSADVAVNGDDVAINYDDVAVHGADMATDVDENGVLDHGEFVAVTIHLQKMENDEHFRRAFIFFDKDGNGYIELDELRDALADESRETDVNALNDIMREVDTDKDRRICYDESVAMMKADTDW